MGSKKGKKKNSKREELPGGIATGLTFSKDGKLRDRFGEDTESV